MFSRKALLLLKSQRVELLKLNKLGRIPDSEEIPF